MDQRETSFIEEEEYDDGITCEESSVEHCVFPWTIKDFLNEWKSDSCDCGRLMFPASNNEDYFTLWVLKLSKVGPQNDIQIELKRLLSQNKFPVFVRFRWEIIDVNGRKVFPGSIHAFAYPTDKLSKKFIEMDQLLEDLPRFLLNGSLRVSCELTAYERKLEDQIYSQVNRNIPYSVNVLADDMERLFFTESGADMRVSSVDDTMQCHKSILSARSSVFSKLIQAETSDECHLRLDQLKGDVLRSILAYLYFGSLDMYLEHTIPKDLYSIATEYDLKHLREHLDIVNSSGLTMLKTLDVTWKLPYFKRLLLQRKVALYCPEPNTSTLYDKRWCFKLEFDSFSEGVDISLVRRQDECSTHHVKFVVRVQKYERTCFEQSKCLIFIADGAQGMEAFITKEELSSMVSSEGTLVLRCSLEVLSCDSLSSRPHDSRLQTFVEKILTHTENSLLKLAQDLRQMYAKEIYSDSVVNTRIGSISYHSFMVDVRLDLPDCDFISFVKDLDLNLVQGFFLFLYGGEVVRKKALYMRETAENSLLLSLAKKLEDFLFFCHGDYEVKLEKRISL